MNRIEIENKERELIAERLLNLLPHGSGINGDWTIFQKCNKNFYYASNFYHSMDSNGFYDKCYDFTVKYRFIGKEFSLININLHGQYIKSDQYGLSDYLYQTCDIMED